MSAIKSAAELSAPELLGARDVSGDISFLAGQKRVLELVATGAPLAGTLDELLRFVEAQEEGMRCGILVLADDGVHFRRGSGPSLPEAYHNNLDGAPIASPYLAPCCEAGHSGVSVVAPDLAGDARWSDEWRALALSCGLAACRSTPICASDGRVLGSLAMYFAESRDPQPASPDLIDVATHLASIAIGQARSRSELREREEQLSRELAQTQHMQEISTLLIQQGDTETLYQRLLDAATAVMGSDMASMQVFDPARGELRLLAWKGFHPISAEFWAWVGADSESACGKALSVGERIVVSDVETSELTKDTADLQEYMRSGIRAVQCTPLVSRSGRPLGMISTHWREKHQPSEQDFRTLDMLARQAADLIERTAAEQALRERSEQLEAVLETAPAGVWFTMDREVRNATGNRHAAEMFRTGESDNLSLSAIEEERPALVICRDGVPLAPDELPLQRAARGEKVAEEELEFRYPDGGAMTVLLRASTLRGCDGEPVGAVAAAIDITARKRAETALRESEESLRLIVDSAKEYAIITLDGEGCITSWNSGAERLLGYSEKEIIGQPGDIFFTSEDRAANAPEREMALARSEGRATNERWHMRKDGSRFWGSGVMLPLATGSASGFLKIFRDRTSERNAEEALAEVSERARRLAAERAAVLGQLAEGVIVTDTEGSITFVNKAAERIHGVARLDVPPEDYTEVFHLFTEEGRPYPTEQLPLSRAVLRGETVTEARWRIRRPDGTEVLAIGSASPVKGEGGNVIGNVLTLRDDTEREAHERELREADLRKNIALGAGQMGVWDWDMVEDRLVWDDAEFALYGLDPQSFKPSNALFESFIHPDDLGPFKAAADAAAATGSALETEYRIVRSDGQERWIGERAVVLRDDAGQPVRMVGVSFDITERKRAEDRRNLLINELNHRVKNTLATVQSIASQTLRNAGIGPAVRDALESRLISLSKTHDVLTRQNWEGARLGEIAAQSLRPFEGEGEPRIIVSGPEVRLSPKAALAISMAFHELATNAVKYGALSNETGWVRVDWEIAEEGLLRIDWGESGGPLVQTPRRKGFGSRLIERSLAAELGGEVKMEYRQSGVTCRIESPL